jgi:hypothetical protein
MAEVLIEFVNELIDEGATYEARACGRERDDGLWEGWIEFVPRGGADSVRTGRETTQPNEADLRYWATGLTGAYLEGALERALRHVEPARRRDRVTSKPSFTEPAPDRARGSAKSTKNGGAELGRS